MCYVWYVFFYRVLSVFLKGLVLIWGSISPHQRRAFLTMFVIFVYCVGFFFFFFFFFFVSTCLFSLWFLFLFMFLCWFLMDFWNFKIFNFFC